MIIYTVTVQAYNIFDIANIWKWYLRVRKTNNEIYFKNVVVNPKIFKIFLVLSKYNKTKSKTIVN